MMCSLDERRPVSSTPAIMQAQYTIGVEMSGFSDKLNTNRFLVTVELNPPKGVDVRPVLDMTERLKGLVDAVNVTESQGAVMTTGSISLAHLLLDRGVEPILQFTCRDRNRMALQSDLLSASVLGMENILCLTGDPSDAGDDLEAKAVFDLDDVGLVSAASVLMSGADMSGNALYGVPRFCIGATVNTGARDLAAEIYQMKRKVDMGASFFQTQAIFHLESFAEFMSRVSSIKVPVLVGITLLKSADMARNLNERLPGVYVPTELVHEIEAAEDRAKKGIEIAARIIREVREISRGVHIIAPGWEEYIPQVIQEAGLDRRR